MSRILAGAIEETGAEKGSLMLLDHAQDELVVRFVLGLPDKKLERKINDGEVPCIRLKRGNGVAGGVLKTGRSALIDDVGKDKSFERKGSKQVGAILCVPLVVDGETFGVLNLTIRAVGKRFADDARERAELIADQAAIAIHRTQIYESVCKDEETGLYTGDLVEVFLDSEVRRSSRYGNDLSVVCAHIHRASLRPGVSVMADLEQVGHAIRRTMRSYVDLAGHFGQGWFVFVLPQTHGKGAEVLCRRLSGEIAMHEPEDSVRRFAVAQLSAGESTRQLVNRAMDGLDFLSPSKEGTQVVLVEAPEE